MSVVAPVTAALSGSIPAAYDLATGTEVGPLALAGIVLALVAIIIVSVSGHDESAEGAGRALTLALVAGVCFGGSVLSYAQTTAESGFWPLAAARVTSVTLLLTAVLVTRTGGTLPREARSPALFAGVLDASANVSLVLALRLGPVAVASVLGALYPVATVLLARLVLHEHIRGWQRVGVALALVAVVLAAVR
jgi:drug/metabolite transporter (DMT)-like permease